MTDIPHIGFIVAAYAATAVVLIGMVASVFLDGRALRRQLARLEDRRSARPSTSRSKDERP